jgi:hypothetical protein
MNEDSMRAFLNQFAASRKEFDELPPWMKESARVASASFPKVQRRAEPEPTEVNVTPDKVQQPK